MNKIKEFFLKIKEVFCGKEKEFRNNLVAFLFIGTILILLALLIINKLIIDPLSRNINEIGSSGVDVTSSDSGKIITLVFIFIGMLIVLASFVKIFYKKRGPEEAPEEMDAYEKLEWKFRKDREKCSGLIYNLTGWKLSSPEKVLATFVFIMFLLPAFGKAVAEILSIIHLILTKMME